MTPAPRRLACVAALASLVLAGRPRTSEADSARDHSAPLPRPPAGSRREADDLYLSSRSFLDTVRHFRRALARQRRPHELLPIYRHRGVLVARFLAREAGDWAAVHVFQHRGQTKIFILRARPLDQSERTR